MPMLVRPYSQRAMRPASVDWRKSFLTSERPAPKLSLNADLNPTPRTTAARNPLNAFASRDRQVLNKHPGLHVKYRPRHATGIWSRRERSGQTAEAACCLTPALSYQRPRITGRSVDVQQHQPVRDLAGWCACTSTDRPVIRGRSAYESASMRQHRA